MATGTTPCSAPAAARLLRLVAAAIADPAHMEEVTEDCDGRESRALAHLCHVFGVEGYAGTGNDLEG